MGELTLVPVSPSEERRAKEAERMRMKRASWSPEQRAKAAAYQRAYRVTHSTTPEGRAKQAARNAKHRATYATELKVKKAAYYVANRERVKERVRSWRAANPRKVKANNLRQSYGLTLEEFDLLMEIQNGLCGICKTLLLPTKSGTHVDHDHATGRIRGLLCGSCNKGLGNFRDSSAFLLAAASYLKGGCS
jgi:hypothetical protein